MAFRIKQNLIQSWPLCFPAVCQRPADKTMKMITGSPTAWLGGQRVTLSARAHGSVEIAAVELHAGITPKSASGSLDGED